MLNGGSMVWGFCVYFVYMIPLETDVLRKHRFQKWEYPPPPHTHTHSHLNLGWCTAGLELATFRSESGPSALPSELSMPLLDLVQGLGNAVRARLPGCYYMQYLHNGELCFLHLVPYGFIFRWSNFWTMLASRKRFGIHRSTMRWTISNGC